MKLSLAALPLRTRPGFEPIRAFCGLAQNSAHHVPVRNSSPSRLRSRATPYHTCNQANIQEQELNFFNQSNQLPAPLIRAPISSRPVR
ncbi:hypothetical protein ACFQHW_01130 [Lapidilactobacillus achengensis]|uniref:Uncharacterized protein n=1 Tax=Lapidilactobacillus achengensis TaxID=2486000 RepID=A0ABW1UMB5_9LACO|nr:hypothetical protein [Lapidilactobacillus achengensis]